MLGEFFFPHVLSGPIGNGITIAFTVSAICGAVAALLSLLRGRTLFVDEIVTTTPVAGPAGQPAALAPVSAGDELARFVQVEAGNDREREK